MTSRTVASPRTSVQQSVTQTLEGVGYGILVANGQLAYADALRSCKILDPLAFNRREEVAHLAATADGVAAAVSACLCVSIGLRSASLLYRLQSIYHRFSCGSTSLYMR